MMPLLTPRLAFAIENLDLGIGTGDEEALWEPFQLEHLNNNSQFDINLKSRQGGYSWTCALEAVLMAILRPRSTSIFVSINLDEAAEKLRYARTIIEALPRRYQPRLLIDNVLEMETDRGSRLISHPCRPIRGKAKARVYLDEFAHYGRDRDIYTSAVPVTSKGGVIRIGSSPLGAGGMFWEIFTETMRRFPGYTRKVVPWWAISALCRETTLAVSLAPQMTTEERVYRFGTSRLINIFENMVLEDFQQEYECAWVDESVSWITWDEIRHNQIDAQEGKLWYRMAKNVDEALRIIKEIKKASLEGIIEQAFSVGVDVGRKRDLTEITITGIGTTTSTPFRCGISLDRIKFDDQITVLRLILDLLPIIQMLIDQNGLGMQLAETMNMLYGDRAQGVNFTAPSKEFWAIEIRVKMQKGQVPIPTDRDLGYQIHSIKRKITGAKNVVFDTAANEKHHADKFWSLALAVTAANRSGRELEVDEQNALSTYRG